MERDLGDGGVRYGLDHFRAVFDDPATLGLGSSVMLLTFIPLLSPVLLTTAATGAVLLYRELEE